MSDKLGLSSNKPPRKPTRDETKLSLLKNSSKKKSSSIGLCKIRPADLKILIVNDEPLILKMLETILLTKCQIIKANIDTAMNGMSCVN